MERRMTARVLDATKIRDQGFAELQNLNSAIETHDPSVEVEEGEEIRSRISQRLWREVISYSNG
jgi:hypothetical protein